MVTINDIARLANVSKSTVSRYLNGGSVSHATKEKLEAIIEETGYIPSAFAQSLKAKTSKMIGVILPRLDSFSANNVLSEIESYFRQYNYQVMMMNANFDVEREAEALQTFRVNKMDGIIYLMSHVREDMVQKVKELTLPIVTVGQELDGVSAIYYDEESAGQQLADYVYSKGYRVLDYLTVAANDPAVGQRRKNALKQKFLSYGDTIWREYQTGFELTESYEITKREIVPHRPSLIIGATDIVTLGAMRAIYEVSGTQATVQFAGFGNNSLSSTIYPGLTTVEYPYRQAGFLAAQVLHQKIQGFSNPVNYKLKTTLLPRF